MPANPVAENVLGTIGTILWTGQLIPQIWKSWREHSTEGLSPSLMLLWSISAILLGVYTTVQHINVPLMIQPQLFGICAALSWTQCLYYSEKRSLRFCIFVFASYCAMGGAFETTMHFVTRHALHKGNPWPLQSLGIMSSIFIAIGLLPQYWEIWKRKEVMGISHVFITVDIMGGVFSILSLGFKSHFDIFAAITYILVVIMDSVILLAAVILNPMARRKRSIEQAQRESRTEEYSGQPVAYRVNSINNAPVELKARLFHSVSIWMFRYCPSNFLLSRTKAEEDHENSSPGDKKLTSPTSPKARESAVQIQVAEGLRGHRQKVLEL